MSERKTYCLILAAGDGKRMKSEKPKVLMNVLFKPMLEWVIDGVEAAGIDKTAVVVGSKKEQVTKFLKSKGEFLSYEQTERKGTGHAVMQAKEFIGLAAKDGADLLITYGDAPFVDGRTIKNSLEAHRKDGNDVTVISADVKEPFGYGRIIRENGGFSSIVEEKDCTDEQKRITEINSGIYWFRPEKLMGYLDKLDSDNAAGEYYLTDTVGFADKKGVYTAESETVVMGANDRRQLAELNVTARAAVFARLFDEGVDIPVTDGVMISPDVKIGSDTTVLPGTIISGHTVIGKNCVIGPNSVIESCNIGSDVILNGVHAIDSTVEDGVCLGPFVYLSAGTHFICEE